MVTKLSIADLDTKDCRFVRFVDNSFYNPDITVENAILEITVPGASCPVFFTVQKDFNTVFNSSLLDIVPTTSYNGLVSLPDGVYHLKYSIKPNNLIYQEFDYFRNCQQLQRYYKASCDLFSKKCDIPKRDFHQKLNHLAWIKQLIDNAKYKVESCDSQIEGLELYCEANDLLDKLC